MEQVIAIVLVGIITAAVAFAWLSAHGRQRLRELAIQERIAMIEKGLVPSPESDPARFEALIGPRPPSIKAVRYRTVGVILTGLGIGQTVLMLGVLRQMHGIAIGVGGAITVLGLTILVNGLLLASDERESSPRNTSTRS